MKQVVKRIAVTGGAGQISYSLLFRIASGAMLGLDQPIALHILELPQVLQAVEGVKMELDDCAFPLLKEVLITDIADHAFEGVDYAILVGAKPRGPGMERADLLEENGKIFVGQGKALNENANRNAKVLVVGNPCNTNCLIAMHHAPSLPRTSFHAMTRLDHNRARSLLAKKSQKEIEAVTNMTIWGNHSSTQVPDFVNAKIEGKRVPDVIEDPQWLEHEFIATVQQRGAAIIKARGSSSAASAANAALGSVKALVEPTTKGDWFSSGVCSDKNPYEVEEGLIFSFPCTSKGDGNYEIVQNVPWNSFLENKIRESEKELLEERDMVRHML